MYRNENNIMRLNRYFSDAITRGPLHESNRLTIMQVTTSKETPAIKLSGSIG